MSDTLGVRSDALVVAGLTWRPHGRRLPTLQQVSLSVRPGERVLLVGASGSGKSTLLQAMAGLLDESLGELSGTVAIGGRRPEAAPGQVGLLLQDPLHSLVAEYAGRDVAFGPENRGLPRSEVQTRAATALTEVEFPYGAEHHATALSGGEMQRLALAGALALEPQILLLDEPTAMLDPASAATVREAVRRTATARGLAVVVVEHRLDGWVDFCDRLVVLGRGGTVLADGDVREVLAARGEELLAAGIWVPGAPAPTVEPLPLTAADRPPLRWPGQSAALRTRDLAVDRPGATTVGAHLVRDLGLDLPRRTSLAVQGRSGSGKSTLLRALAGLTAPASGTVELGTGSGLRPAGEVARRSTELAGSVGWLPQHAEQVVTRRTVLAEVLATGVALGQPDPAAAEQRAIRLLEALGIAHLRDANPYEISGGEQRRLALAATLAHAPLLMLLDEPTVGQDRQTWTAVLAVIEEAVRGGSAVVATTHDADFAARLDRTLELDHPPAAAPRHAVLSSSEEAQALRQVQGPDHRVREVVEVGSPPTAQANPLALLLVAAGAAVGSFFVSTWLVGALTLLVTLLLSPLAVRRVRPALVRLVPVGIAALTVGWSTILFSSRGFLSPESVPIAAKEILRIGCLVVPGALLVTSLRPSALGDALVLRLRLPHRPVVAATSALLRLETLFAQWQSLVDIRRIRGLAPGRSVLARARHLGSVTLALLVSVLRSAQQMAVSMDARGFAGARHRTSALGSPWRARDWVCCGVAAMLLTLPVLLGRLI